VDVGSVRVGVAASDPAATLAFPVAVLRRDPRHHRDVEELASIVADREAVEVVIGLPQTLRGRESRSTADARAYAVAVAARVAPVPVRLLDERLTTVSAARQMREAGRDAKSSRGMMDAAAAVVMLDAALDRERHTGIPAGEQVHP
jgi:putative Holliday junction resolvase